MTSNFSYSVLIHYSEIALKKNNRRFFENIFLQNIKIHLKNISYKSIKLINARVLVYNIQLSDWNNIKIKLSHVMGLKNYMLVIKTNSNIDSINIAAKHIIKDKKFKSYSIHTKRSNKAFSLNSQEVNTLIGQNIKDITNKKVDLTNPEITVYIEILLNCSFVGIEKINGFSGLPANCQEKALSLISSGIDSPVSSFEVIKRGVNLDYIHFHSYPATNKQSINNVKKIINELTKYQLNTTLYLVPLLKIQEKIMEQVPEKFWVVFFRRYMMMIANDVAKKINALALITGDSIGQVSSQTLSNIYVVSEASELPIIRPLAGMNKEEIINKAKKINTYDLSIEPYEDCCSFFVPAHPSTKSKLFDINRINKKLDLNKLYIETTKNIEIIKLNIGDS
jgi:thiamine biosynthesis protein ThiI